MGIAAQAHAASSYVLNCDAQKQGRVTVQLSSFSFRVNAPAGMQTAQGRTTYELVVNFPAGKAYAVFQQAVQTNELMRTCQLTESEGGATARTGIGGSAGAMRGGETMEWQFTDAVLSSTTAVGSDGSGANANGVPQGSMQAVFTFRNYSFAARP